MTWQRRDDSLRRTAQAPETRVRVFSSWPEGALGPGVDVATAVDVHAALCSVDVSITLVSERGRTPERVEAWWRRAPARELLA
ncbi:hypothetical protein ACIBHY_01575 [Nonomuraea sp. NPDC050547]|uniref:hypothetical protein n=1 Tax=Nonomuraea sp. NPDC050547 TaxID=3364368 RepID=UPI00378F4E55